jgi:hypothetical protein
LACEVQSSPKTANFSSLLKGLQDLALLLLGFFGNLPVTKTTGRQIIRTAANNASGQLPVTATVVRNPSVHAQDVQGAHRVEVDPFPHVIAESDIAIKLVPRLAGPDWAELSLTRWGGAVRTEQSRGVASC